MKRWKPVFSCKNAVFISPETVLTPITCCCGRCRCSGVGVETRGHVTLKDAPRLVTTCSDVTLGAVRDRIVSMLLITWWPQLNWFLRLHSGARGCWFEPPAVKFRIWNQHFKYDLLNTDLWQTHRSQCFIWSQDFHTEIFRWKLYVVYQSKYW